MSRCRRIQSAWMVALSAGLLLVGCAEEAPGPQFANAPLPSRTPTAVTSGSPTLPTVAAATPVPAATPASIGDLLRARGAPGNVFLASDDAIWVISSGGEARRLFEAPAGSRVLAIDPAPGATEVAILLESEAADARSRELVVVDIEGETLARIDELASGPATPTAAGGLSADLVDWSPQGDRLLVASRDGAIVGIGLDKESDPVGFEIDAGGRTILRPAWSPTGEAIAFIAASEDNRERSLAIFHTSDQSVVEVVRPDDGRFVVDFAWMPDGVSLLFTEGGNIGGAVSGIDLWRIDGEGENRTLVASAGTVAPVARITNARPSPDGRSVAYAVLVPGENGPRVNSVWVRDLASGVGFRIPLPSVSTIEDLVWTDQGLVVSVTTTGTGPERPPVVALLLVKVDGTVEALWAAPIAIATPAAGTPLAGTEEH